MHTVSASVLYHAAAYKHVPMMEEHVFAAVENNIFGTWQVPWRLSKTGSRTCDDLDDKAVRPTSMMGANKRVAELVIQALQQETGTKFVAVRFGMCSAATGVWSNLQRQIAAGGPVTVTTRR